MKNKLRESRLFKNISKLGFIIIGCLVLASFSPSLDGRAVVVDSGVFPEGLFAKTVGYLPGDIISVTNITGDATIDILVIGKRRSLRPATLGVTRNNLVPVKVGAIPLR